ncbi:MAG: NAD(P)H-dependent oxidoreductase subunit E, partial [Desulfovermiculus sp.]
MADQSTARNLESSPLGSHAELNELRESILASRDPAGQEIIVCHGTGCVANGSPKVAQALNLALQAANKTTQVAPGIKKTGCHGFCSRGPLVIVNPYGYFYQKVGPKDAEDIVEQSILQEKPVERLLYKDPQSGEPILSEKEIPFYKLQQRSVLRNIGKIDPTDITDTIAAGGYQALAKALTSMTPQQV